MVKKVSTSRLQFLASFADTLTSRRIPVDSVWRGMTSLAWVARSTAPTLSAAYIVNNAASRGKKLKEFDLPKRIEGCSLPKAQWRQARTEASQSRNPAARKHFLENIYNCYIAPALQVEEAALQMLSQDVAYMYLEEGYRVKLHIKRQLTADVCSTHYSRDNMITARIVDARSECVAYLIEPEHGQGASIILFRGTSVGEERDCLTLEWPWGVDADFADGGVAKAEFEFQREVLLGWARSTFAEGRKLVITGHSLGAAWAARLMASLTPAQQCKTQLMCFSPPGLERTIITGIAAGQHNVRSMWHRGDWVTSAGELLPAGLVFEVGHETEAGVGSHLIAQHVHTHPALAIWQLWGDEELSLRSGFIARPVNGSVSEAVRAQVSNVLHPVRQAASRGTFARARCKVPQLVGIKQKERLAAHTIMEAGDLPITLHCFVDACRWYGCARHIDQEAAEAFIQSLAGVYQQAILQVFCEGTAADASADVAQRALEEYPLLPSRGAATLSQKARDFALKVHLKLNVGEDLRRASLLWCLFAANSTKEEELVRYRAYLAILPHEVAEYFGGFVYQHFDIDPRHFPAAATIYEDSSAGGFDLKRLLFALETAQRIHQSLTSE